MNMFVALLSFYNSSHFVYYCLWCKGEKLKHKDLQGYGNKTIIDGEEQAIGAGGKFGGVHLAMSDQKTQENNMAMLKAMFDREKKKRRRKEQKNDLAAEEE